MENNYIKSTPDKVYFTKRLNIIGGQIRGVSKMINENRSYEEVLIQLGALTNSLKSMGLSIIENYLQNNVLNDQDKVKEIMNLYDKLV